MAVRVTLPYRGPISLSSLKKLHFYHVTNEVDLRRLLAGCPVLEELIIDQSRCFEWECTTISSPTLKRLTINFPSYRVKINAPARRYLKVYFDMYDQISVSLMKSLIEADISLGTIAEPNHRCVLKFLDSLCKFKCLKLSDHYFDETLSFPLASLTVKFGSLTKLELSASWCFLTKFLESADQLQVLIIRECTEQDFNMVRFVLGNAQVLERMEISCPRESVDLKKKFDVIQRISLFRRGSKESTRSNGCSRQLPTWRGTATPHPQAWLIFYSNFRNRSDSSPSIDRTVVARRTALNSADWVLNVRAMILGTRVQLEVWVVHQRFYSVHFRIFSQKLSPPFPQTQLRQIFESSSRGPDEGFGISQPALDLGKFKVHHHITVRNRRSRVHSWVEMMAPVFSRSAWRCVWYMIQGDGGGEEKQRMEMEIRGGSEMGDASMGIKTRAGSGTDGDAGGGLEIVVLKTGDAVVSRWFVSLGRWWFLFWFAFKSRGDSCFQNPFPFSAFCYGEYNRIKHKARFNGLFKPETIYMVMLLHKSKTINTFSLTHMYHYNGCHLNAWIKTAVEHNVQNLILHAAHRFPRCLFTCKTLVDLSLPVCTFNPSCGPSSLPSLKKLHLNDIEYYEADDKAFPRFLSSCPVLEELIVKATINPFLGRFDISSPTIKRLTINFPCYGREFRKIDYRVVIDAPALEYLRIIECSSEHILLSPMNSLIEADVCLNNDSVRRNDLCYLSMCTLFKCLRNVKCLKLSGRYNESELRYMEFIDRAIDGPSVRFDNLTKLELTADWRLLTKLIENADNLQVLTIHEVWINLVRSREFHYSIENPGNVKLPSFEIAWALHHHAGTRTDQMGCTKHDFNVV
ncbi:F-box/FBD/LRR-repeat protein at5g56420 [Phtheirospermum japonicum]|uniref:F-box/FBD/LRR-repeat protein at5g56420 n=1 Tax=Phtheirospermum japonicum TaxID=374723 RepID=A0A830CBB9_9LAMI|nr:F-box/FBD/LRR-repeat protein at5g56420 [Phtheirospermum japonicum]